MLGSQNLKHSGRSSPAKEKGFLMVGTLWPKHRCRGQVWGLGSSLSLRGWPLISEHDLLELETPYTHGSRSSEQVAAGGDTAWHVQAIEDGGIRASKGEQQGTLLTTFPPAFL